MIYPNHMALRMFAIYPKVIEPRSITELEKIGRSNLALTKKFGLDYEKILRDTEEKQIGVKN